MRSNSSRARTQTTAPTARRSATPSVAAPSVRKQAPAAQPTPQAPSASVAVAARKTKPVLLPATPESPGKGKLRRKRLSKAFPLPLEENSKKARKKELKRVLKALQALADEGMVSGRYSLPGDEYAQFTDLRRRLEESGTPAKKNHLIRAGLLLLTRLPLAELVATLAELPETQEDAAAESEALV